MTIREILQAIYDDAGDLTPELLVERAAAPDHPLHHRFEWDDTKAAQAWRLEQGAQLIRSVRISFVTDNAAPSDLRAFVAVKGAETHRASYVPTSKALADPFTREVVLRDMRREWMNLKRRYQHMQEFAAMIRADVKGGAA